jgi:hypothetical protein
VSGKAFTSLEALLLAVNRLKAWAAPNEEAAPVVKEYVPGWQLRHVESPLKGEKTPTPQNVQLVLAANGCDLPCSH